MSFALRAPNPADVDALAELHVATWREAYAHLLPEDFFTDEFLEGRRRMWTRLTSEAPEGVRVSLAETPDGEIVGFAVAGSSLPDEEHGVPRDLQLFMIYVAAAHYGTGAGQALLDAALGPGPALLWVAKENPRAIAFYRRNGFELDGAEQRDPGAPRITDVRMVR